MAEETKIDREGLMAKAKLYGIKFPKNITSEKLLDKIDQYEDQFAQEAQKKVAGASKLKPIVDEDGHIVAVPPVPPKGHLNADMINVYIKLTNLNPDERELQTAFVAVGNAATEFYLARYVPFGKPWPVPYALVKELQNKKMQIHRKELDKETGKPTRTVAEQVAHYAVEFL
jgi:hypothetical protein